MVPSAVQTCEEINIDRSITCNWVSLERKNKETWDGLLSDNGKYKGKIQRRDEKKLGV